MLSARRRGRCARFEQFVRGPRAALLGHNLLGGWMVLASMSCVTGLALTGWLCTSDALLGDEAIERVHGVLAWVLLGLVVVHVAGVFFTSLRHRENLSPRCSAVRSAPADNDVV